MVLQLLRELLKVGLPVGNHLARTCLLQYGPVPVVGSHGSQQDSVLAPGKNVASDPVSRALLKTLRHHSHLGVPLPGW